MAHNEVDEYPEFFQPGLVRSRRPPVSVNDDPAATPKVFKGRQIPLPLRPKVDDAIDKLVEQGIFKPVRNSSWATSVVSILKKNGNIRLCGDYKCTVNRAIRWETYPLPTADLLFAKLAMCEKSSQLDLGQACSGSKPHSSPHSSPQARTVMSTSFSLEMV